MKKVDKSATTERNFDELISKFSGNEVLNVYAMQSVKGGDGDGGADIILMPPKPPEGT